MGHLATMRYLYELRQTKVVLVLCESGHYEEYYLGSNAVQSGRSTYTVPDEVTSQKMVVFIKFR